MADEKNSALTDCDKGQIVPERVNEDFSEVALVQIEGARWYPSPMKGVERRILDRVGGEVARATSVVKFQPGYHFSPHTHGGGEEYFVLSGVFSDESGDYGAGWYVRNPPGSRHQPSSHEGCEIFVKLCQMRGEGEPSLAVDTNAILFEPSENVPGLARKLLFKAPQWPETVAIERLEAGALLEEIFTDAAEILLLSGELLVDESRLSAPGWVRFPSLHRARIEAIDESEYWIKRGIMFP